MRDDDHIELVVERDVEHKTRAVAVTQRAELLHALPPQGGDDLPDHRLRSVGPVPAEPRAEVEAYSAGVERVWRGSVGEDVGNDDLESVARIVIREELRSRTGVSSWAQIQWCNPMWQVWEAEERSVSPGG